MSKLFKFIKDNGPWMPWAPPISPDYEARRVVVDPLLHTTIGVRLCWTDDDAYNAWLEKQ